MQTDTLDVESDEASDGIVTYSDPAPLPRPSSVQRPATITLSSPPSSDPLSSYNVMDTFHIDQGTATRNDISTRKPHDMLTGIPHAYSRKRPRTHSTISDHDRSVEGAEAHDSSALSSATDSAQLELRRILQFRSTNIPDFIRYIFRVDSKGIHERVDLIVENKAQRGPRITTQAHSTLLQARNQAIHAFAEDPTANVIGAIIAIRDFWRYSEFLRNPDATKELEKRVRETRNQDTFYKPPQHSPSSSSNNQSSSPASIDNTWDNTALTGPQCELQQQLWDMFPKGFLLKIGDNKTPGAITLIAKRLREINPEFWSTTGEGTPVEDDDSEESESQYDGRRGMGDRVTDSSDESDDDSAEEGEGATEINTNDTQELGEDEESDGDY